MLSIIINNLDSQHKKITSNNDIKSCLIIASNIFLSNKLNLLIYICYNIDTTIHNIFKFIKDTDIATPIMLVIAFSMSIP